jgi:hypothetical protein
MNLWARSSCAAVRACATAAAMPAGVTLGLLQVTGLAAAVYDVVNATLR